MSQTSDLQIGVETTLPYRFLGKQVYAVLVDFGALPALNSEKSMPHGITDLDQFGIDNSRSFVDQGNGTRHALFYPNTVPNAFWRAKVNHTDVAMQVGEDRTAFSAMICVWYTKASEQTGGDEVTLPLLDYSYAEQWTGQYWVDGKKIYQKTVNCGAMTSTYKDTASGISNMDTLVSITTISKDSLIWRPFSCVPVKEDVTGYIGIVIEGSTIRCHTSGRKFSISNVYTNLLYTCTDR